MKLKDYPKIAPVLISAILIILSVIIISPLLSSLLTAGVLAYVFYPIYMWLNKRLNSKSWSAFVVSLSIVLALVLLFVFVTNSMANEAFNIYNQGKGLANSSFNCEEDETDLVICKIAAYAREKTGTGMFDSSFDEAIKQASSGLLSVATNLIVGIPGILLNFFVIFFTMFFILRDSEQLRKKIQVLMPMKKTHQQKIFARVNDTVYAIIYGNLIIAIIQGILAMIGFYIFNVDNPILFGVLTIIFSFMPYVGSVVVWLPIVLLRLLNGFLTGNNSDIWSALFLALYSLLIVSSIDNILKPKLIGDRGRIHPVVVLVGVLGGLIMMGPIGVVVGPLVLSLALTFVEIYQEESGI